MRRETAARFQRRLSAGLPARLPLAAVRAAVGIGGAAGPRRRTDRSTARIEERLDRREVEGESAVDGGIVDVIAGIIHVRAASARKLADELTRAVDDGGAAASSFGSRSSRSTVDPLTTRPPGAGGSRGVDMAVRIGLG